jgi:hypothetical protein
MLQDTRSVYQLLARPVNLSVASQNTEVRHQTLTPETLQPETLNPETLNPETLKPERIS